MANIIEGDKSKAQGSFAVVVSRYNESITGNLLKGAIETLVANGIEESSIDVAWVPGAWEIPLVAREMVATEAYAAVLCLGAVIRGETTHDQYINQQVSRTLGQLALDFHRPVLFGLLTCNTLDQAIHRSGGNVGNKGAECVEAALEMVSLLQKLPR